MIKRWNQKNMKECDKRKSHKQQTSCDLIPSNNVRHPVSKTYTTLYYTLPNYTCRHFTSSHLNFTQLHFSTFSLT